GGLGGHVKRSAVDLQAAVDGAEADDPAGRYVEGACDDQDTAVQVGGAGPRRLDEAALEAELSAVELQVAARLLEEHLDRGLTSDGIRLDERAPGSVGEGTRHHHAHDQGAL